METNRIISKSQQELYSLYDKLSVKYLEIFQDHIKDLAGKEEINIVDVGGGGGHFAVGTCQVSYDDADQIIEKFIKQLKEDDSEEI